jgi:hypothetical protein
MFRFALASTLVGAVRSDDHPHLAQAWQALSSGDGLPNTVGLESYIFEEGCEKSDTCMRAHVFDYGADNCIKYEVDAGFHSKYSGTFYVKCDSVNCCRDQDWPNVKQWDIGQAKKSTITHKDPTDLDDLDGHVAGADTWEEDIKAFGKEIGVKYTYYVSQSGDDIISHAIDYVAPGAAPGRILYGNFTVKHADELDEFRKVFHAPSACQGNVLTCPPDFKQKWGRKSMSMPVAV